MWHVVYEWPHVWNTFNNRPLTTQPIIHMCHRFFLSFEVMYGSSVIQMGTMGRGGERDGSYKKENCHIILHQVRVLFKFSANVCVQTFKSVLRSRSRLEPPLLGWSRNQCCGAATFLGGSGSRWPRSRSRLRLRPTWVGSGSRQKRRLRLHTLKFFILSS